MPEQGPHEWEPKGGPKGTLGRFIYENDIKLDYDPIPERPDRKDVDEKEQEWQDSAFHYKVTLKRGSKRLTTYFSMGSAHRDPPEADMVLDSLASDASGIDNARDFEEWASEYGYDTDSRKAEKDYNTSKILAEKLKKFLGEALYKTLLYDVERQ